jgi:hypothetical protein
MRRAFLETVPQRLLGSVLLFFLTIAASYMAADIWAWAIRSRQVNDVWFLIALMAAVPWLGDLGIRMLLGRMNDEHLILRMAPRRLILGGAIIVGTTVWSALWRADIHHYESIRAAAVGVVGGLLAVAVGFIRQYIESHHERDWANVVLHVERGGRHAGRRHGTHLRQTPRYRVSFKEV